MHTTSDHPNPEREIGVLAGQADALLKKLGIAFSDQGRNSGVDPETLAFERYERLATAERESTQVAWERTVVDGRNGRELMARLWEIRDYLLQGRRASNAARQKPE